MAQAGEKRNFDGYLLCSAAVSYTHLDVYKRQIYESSFGYFKANARFHIEKTAVVDRLEKLQCIDPATVRYIVQHPEQLKRVNSSAGIRIAARVYHPQKALAFQNACSYDIYENKVILGFLYMVVSSVAELGNRCRELLEQIPHEENYSRRCV